MNTETEARKEIEALIEANAEQQRTLKDATDPDLKKRFHDLQAIGHSLGFALEEGDLAYARSLAGA